MAILILLMMEEYYVRFHYGDFKRTRSENPTLAWVSPKKNTVQRLLHGWFIWEFCHRVQERVWG